MSPKLLTKYMDYRKNAQNGDIILTFSEKPVAKSIQLIDDAYYHHSELVHWSYGRLMGFGAHPEGAGPDFLSARFREKGWTDFCIIRPKHKPIVRGTAMAKAYESAEKYNQYDFGMIIRIVFWQFGKFDVAVDKGKKYICSELTHFYCRCLGEDLHTNRPFFTPEDHLRTINDNFEVLYNEQ